MGDRILGVGEFRSTVDLLSVTDDAFDATPDTFDRYRDHPITFTGATTVTLIDDHDLDHLLSFDDDFGGVVDRLDPASL